MELSNLVSAEPEVDIQTPSSDRRVTIWAVVDGDDVYVRSFKGPQGRWYQDAIAHPDVVLWTGDQPFDLHAVPVADDAVNDRVSTGYLTKYASSRWAETMTTPEIRATTLRLDPR
jgi:hypothetical protein